MQTIFYIFWAFLAVGILLALLRVIMGPKIYDRLAALDTMNILIVGVLVFIALILKKGFYLDVALIYAGLSFVETIVFARLLEKMGGNNVN
jgi:multicomponent Na+:H+ antiporter subunit F